MDPPILASPSHIGVAQIQLAGARDRR